MIANPIVNQILTVVVILLNRKLTIIEVGVVKRKVIEKIKKCINKREKKITVIVAILISSKMISLKIKISKNNYLVH